MLAGLFVAPTQSASALGCVLGPSLASAAKAAGVSCPDVEGGGGGGAAWGAAGGACAYGWQKGQLPDGMLEYLAGSTWHSESHVLDSGEKVSVTTYLRSGRAIGQVQFRSTRSTFVFGISIYGRAGLKEEFAYFDCMQSKDGPIYSSAPYGSPMVMPAAGSPTVPATVRGPVQTRGAMTALPDGKYLLRVDVTNAGSSTNFASIALGLAGYAVEGFPSLPGNVSCEPVEGLICSADGILPGQTVTTVLILSAPGDTAATSTIDVMVASQGLVKTKVSVGSPRVNRSAVVTDFYEVVRP
ncbi:hypothetical protein [Herbiconiux flava]|uniref:Uncharacterized protein n=1 Tax=Herbiconiux flava TaxID=881268 RepID=A0A852STM4_9MICO|nr:hypothetical protein [Herbiconiux flava]NYD72004.1 hypothetical protein [Herbiconiux flava]